MRTQTALIVEDSYLLLEIVATLCQTGGVRVLEASTGEAALTILRDRGPGIDWLMTDIALPGLIDGRDVARAFRALHPDRPVVYLSASPDRPAHAVPGSLFLRKPFQVREINQVVRALTHGLSDAPLGAAV